MREQFQQELQYLQDQLSKMFVQVIEAFESASALLRTGDVTQADRLIEADRRINQKEIDLEMDCARLIALQQPVVSDLRLVIAIIQMSSDLERIGDHSASLAKSSKKLYNHKQAPDIEEKITEMAKEVSQLCRESLDIFRTMNDQATTSIPQKIEAIDYLRKSIVELSRLKMKEDASYVSNGAEYISIIMHIKRIADYAANICERVVYVQTGQVVELS